MRRTRNASALPHRGKPDIPYLLRHDLLAESGRLHQASHWWSIVVPKQLAPASEQRVFGAVRSSSQPEDGFGGKWDRMGAVHARGDGLRARRERSQVLSPTPETALG